jgi:4-hydroxy-3-methylbut-2-enyl diphosphate reductase
MIGHKGHPEVDGTLGQDPTSKKMHLIEKISDIHHLNISDPNKIAYVTQTTLSLDETKDVIKELKSKFPMIEGPKADDICYATQNRQDAIKQILPQADILFVVGSKNSSNSNRLKELGEKKGIPSILIDDMSDFNPAWLDNKKNIAITAGASAPEILIKQLTKLIQSHSNAIINEIDGPKENIKFKLPII